MASLPFATVAGRIVEPPEAPRAGQHLRYLGEIALLATAYVLTAHLGLLLEPVSGFATLVWPPTGIVLGVLALRGLRLWPGAFAGAVLANLWIGAPIPVALGIAAGSTLEGVLALCLLQWVSGSRVSLERVREVLALALGAGCVGAAVSATLGTLSLAMGRMLPPGAVPETWWAWWLGDLLGVLLVTPLLLTWRQVQSLPRLRANQVLEALALAGTVAAVGWVVFVRSPVEPLGAFPLTDRSPYMLFPVLIWAALRFGPRGAAATMFLVATLAVWGTVTGTGPFVLATLSQSLFRVQLFIGVCSLTALTLAAAVSERQEALRAKDRLLAIVSHDLKNPLATLQLSTRLLLKLPLEGADPRARARVEAMDRASQRMLSLISDVLEEAGLRLGHLPVKLEPLALSALLSEATEAVLPLTQERAQTLEVEAPRGLAIRGDSKRLHQVFSNLLGNAAKFTPEGGRITIWVDVSGRWARCAVSDTGPGIARDQLCHIFEPFWAGQNGEGTGLGLAIARSIVEAHGGQIWARSQLGVGTTVFFTLPLDQERARRKLRGGSTSPANASL